jgi:hypothetical protein
VACFFAAFEKRCNFVRLRLFREQQTEGLNCKFKPAHDFLFCGCLAEKGLGRHGASGQKRAWEDMARAGWYKQEYVYQVVMHLDIIDEKIWIHQNNSDARLSQELFENGIPKEDIILGFMLPSRRVYATLAA